MKVLSGNLKDKDINFTCACCHAVSVLESTEDFYISWVSKPVNNQERDDLIKIPQYSVKCPVCGYINYIGLDPRDCGEDFGAVNRQGLLADIIFNREDWESRYKVSM